MTDAAKYEWVVYEGRPSWHQQQAGQVCAAATTGFRNEADARAHAANLKKHHPDLHIRVGRRL